MFHNSRSYHHKNSFTHSQVLGCMFLCAASNNLQTQKDGASSCAQLSCPSFPLSLIWRKMYLCISWLLQGGDSTGSLQQLVAPRVPPGSWCAAKEPESTLGKSICNVQDVHPAWQCSWRCVDGKAAAATAGLMGSCSKGFFPSSPSTVLLFAPLWQLPEPTVRWCSLCRAMDHPS